jgi:hypothetical protein
MKVNSRGSKVFILSAITACLVATTAQDASARHHKNAEKDSTPPDSQVSMEIFPIQRGYDGAQFIVTKAGYTVSIPGLGVAPDATQIAAYKDEQNNIWYIDRNGVPVKLTNEQVQWGMAQINQQAQARAMAAGEQPITQSAPAAAAPSTTVVVQQQPAQTSSGTVSTLATGLAAAGGAMAGAALSNSLYHNNYYGIPYGVPVYHHGGKYYYNGSNGNKVYINNSSNNKSINQINQWNHQTNWQNTQHNNHPTQLPAGKPSGGHANYPTQLPVGRPSGGHGNVPTHGGRIPASGHAARPARGRAAGISGGGARGGRRR